jgi:hypothetical protein
MGVQRRVTTPPWLTAEAVTNSLCANDSPNRRYSLSVLMPHVSPPRPCAAVETRDTGPLANRQSRSSATPGLFR